MSNYRKQHCSPSDMNQTLHALSARNRKSLGAVCYRYQGYEDNGLQGKALCHTSLYVRLLPDSVCPSW